MPRTAHPTRDSGEPPPFVRLASHPLRWRLLRELVQSDRTVRELTLLVDEPQSLVSYHLRLLREGGLVTARRSSADGRDSYYAIDLIACREALQSAGSALHPSLRARARGAGVSTNSSFASSTAGVVLVHGQQRAVPDRRSAARAHVGRGDPSCQRRQPTESTASQRRPRASAATESTSARTAPSTSTSSAPSGSTR